MTLDDGRIFEERQPHIRGGRHAPLSREELVGKFHGNLAYAGWDRAQGERLLAAIERMFDADAIDLSALRPA
jgi:hypothetical protein